MVKAGKCIINIKFITNLHKKIDGTGFKFLVPLKISSLGSKGRLIADSQTCSSCSGVAMRLGKRGDVSDGCVCGGVHKCITTKSVRENSFFTKSRMPLKKWLLLLHYRVRQYPAKDASEEAMVDNSTVCDV